MKFKLVSIKNDETNKHFRVMNAKWIVKTDKWKVFLRNEANSNPNGVWKMLDDLQPMFGYDWMDMTKHFFWISNIIPQCDGKDDVTDETPTNIGVELQQMTSNMQANAEEIEAICEDIEENGIDKSNIRVNKRFNQTGLATQVNA